MFDPCTICFILATNPVTNFGKWRNTTIADSYGNEYVVCGDYYIKLDTNEASAQFVVDNPVILEDLKNSNEYGSIQRYLRQHKQTIKSSLTSIGMGDLFESKVNINTPGSTINHAFGQLVYKNGSTKNLRVWHPYWQWRIRHQNLMRFYIHLVTFAVGGKDSKQILHWFQIVPFLGTLHSILTDIFEVKMLKNKYVYEWADWHKRDKIIYKEEYEHKILRGDLVVMDDGEIVEYWEVDGYFQRQNKPRVTSWVEYRYTADAPPSESESESESQSDNGNNDFVMTTGQT